MFLRIVTSQIRYKWGIALLILLAMTSLVSLYVYSKNTTSFTNRSMRDHWIARCSCKRRSWSSRFQTSDRSAGWTSPKGGT